MAAQKAPAQRKNSKASAPKSRRPRNEGGLYERQGYRTDPTTGERLSFKFWQATREVSEDHLPPSVERKRITGNSATKKEAKARLEKNWRAFHSPESIVKRRHRGTPRMTVTNLFAEWHKTTNLAGRVSDTMASKYEGYFRLHILPHIGHRYADDLDEKDLEVLFYSTLAGKRKFRKATNGTESDEGPLLSTSAIRNIYMGLSNCFNWAVRARKLVASPLKAVPVPKRHEPDDDIEAASVNAKKLLKAIANSKDPNYCRWLLQFLGLRRAERLGLCWSNVRGLDTHNPTLAVKQQLARYADKSGWYIKTQTKTRKPRTIVIPEPFLSALRAHKMAQDNQKRSVTWKPDPKFADLVFLQPNGSIYTLNRDNQEWHDLLTSHRLPYWRAHLNRHITATWLAEEDPPMQMGTVFAILGHESEALGYYYAKTTERQQSAPLRRYGQTIAQYTARKHSRK